MEDQHSVLNYWFGTDPDDARLANERASLWWSKNPDVDDEIRKRFEPLVLTVGKGTLNDWRSTAHGKLALILLTDQFPRNIFRGTPEAFAFDEIALDLSLQVLAAGEEKRLRPIQRVFFYMPLEHSEELEHQHRSVDLFQELVLDVPESRRPTFAGFLNFAIRHCAIIEQFDRFPHRNAILGRESTSEEIEFLKQPGSSF
jgi:uncharacterized protein (DUF924 family)